MATTASASSRAGTRCVAHVGDSRVYGSRKGELSQITHEKWLG